MQLSAVQSTTSGESGMHACGAMAGNFSLQSALLCLQSSLILCYQPTIGISSNQLTNTRLDERIQGADESLHGVSRLLRATEKFPLSRPRLSRPLKPLSGDTSHRARLAATRHHTSCSWDIEGPQGYHRIFGAFLLLLSGLKRSPLRRRQPLRQQPLPHRRHGDRPQYSTTG